MLTPTNAPPWVTGLALRSARPELLCACNYCCAADYWSADLLGGELDLYTYDSYSLDGFGPILLIKML